MNIELPETGPKVAPLIDETPEVVVEINSYPGYCAGTKEKARRLKQIQKGLLQVN